MGRPSPRSCRAPTSTRSSSPRSSRARSRSTRRSAPAPSAPASARACRSTRTLLLGDPTLSIAEGVILPWTSQGKSLYNYYEKLLDGLARDLGFSLDTPWEELAAEARAGRAARRQLRGQGAVAQPLRPRDELHVRLRGRRALHRAAVPAGRDRRAARPLVRVPARGAVPGLRRQAAEARGALGAHPRAQHRRRRRC